jgi:hypothetical protein
MMRVAVLLYVRKLTLMPESVDMEGKTQNDEAELLIFTLPKLPSCMPSITKQNFICSFLRGGFCSDSIVNLVMLVIIFPRIPFPLWVRVLTDQRGICKS